MTSASSSRSAISIKQRRVRRAHGAAPELRAECRRAALLEQLPLEEADRLGQALVDGHEVVLLLDRDRAVVADRRQHAQQAAPEVLAVAVADGPKDPRAVEEELVRLGVEDAVDGDVARIE